MILDAFEPIRTRTPETARRTRQHIAAVLDYAHARGWRERSPDVKALAAKGLAPQTDRLCDASLPTIFAYGFPYAFA